MGHRHAVGRARFVLDHRVPALLVRKRTAGLPAEEGVSRALAGVRDAERARFADREASRPEDESAGCYVATDEADGDGVIEPHYTTAQVASLLSVNPETVRRLAARGQLRFVRVGSELRFSEAAIRDYLERNAGAAA